MVLPREGVMQFMMLSKCVPVDWESHAEVVHVSLESDKSAAVLIEKDICWGTWPTPIHLDCLDVIFKPKTSESRLFWTMCGE